MRLRVGMRQPLFGEQPVVDIGAVLPATSFVDVVRESLAPFSPHVAGTKMGAFLFLTRITRNFAFRVSLAFRPTT